MEQHIAHFLRRIGFRATHLGFIYYIHAVMLVMENESYLRCLTKGLYARIAETFRTSARSVEHALRTDLDAFWRRGNIRLLEELIGYPLTGKPSVGEFIDILSSHIKMTASGLPPR